METYELERWAARHENEAQRIRAQILMRRRAAENPDATFQQIRAAWAAQRPAAPVASPKDAETARRHREARRWGKGDALLGHAKDLDGCTGYGDDAAYLEGYDEGLAILATCAPPTPPTAPSGERGGSDGGVEG